MGDALPRNALRKVSRSESTVMARDAGRSDVFSRDARPSRIVAHSVALNTIGERMLRLPRDPPVK